MEYIFIVFVLISVLLFWNYLYMQTPRYKREIARIEKFKYADGEKYIVINTGSNHAYYSIDWNLIDVKGFNLASGSQSILWDKKLLHKYIQSVEKRGDGKVVIALSALVLGFIDYAHDISNKRYYLFADAQNIPNYTWWKKVKYCYCPIFSNWRNFIYVFYRRDNKVVLQDNRSPEYEAQLRVNGWKEQFRLRDLQQAESAMHLQPVIKKTIKIVREMVDECRQYGVIPILIIPPVSRFLNAMVSEEFLAEVLYNPLRKNFEDVVLLDYLRDERFQDINLYMNSDFMNLEGRRLFTKVLWHDIRSIKDKR